MQKPATVHQPQGRQFGAFQFNPLHGFDRVDGQAAYFGCLRYRIAAREGLESDSDIMLDQTRTIDNRRIASGLLTILTEQEIAEVETFWRIVLGL